MNSAESESIGKNLQFILNYGMIPFVMRAVLCPDEQANRSVRFPGHERL